MFDSRASGLTDNNALAYTDGALLSALKVKKKLNVYPFIHVQL